jgi:DNA-binding NarL/FixJ family response regulator
MIRPCHVALPNRDVALSRAVTIVAGSFDSLVHRGLRSLLDEDRSVRLLASGLDSASLESVVAQEMPQVVILDGRTGESALERVKKRAAASETGILVLTHQPSRADLAGARSLGVACLSFSAADSDLLAAVYLVAQGEPVYTSGDGRRVVHPRPLATTHDLTDRENEVLGTLASTDLMLRLHWPCRSASELSRSMWLASGKRRESTIDVTSSECKSSCTSQDRRNVCAST